MISKKADESSIEDENIDIQIDMNSSMIQNNIDLNSSEVSIHSNDEKDRKSPFVPSLDLGNKIHQIEQYQMQYDIQTSQTLHSIGANFQQISDRSGRKSMSQEYDEKFKQYQYEE